LNAGTGYSGSDTVIFNGGGCTQQPIATVDGTAGTILGLNFSQPGLGCNSAPTVSIASPGGGTGAQIELINGAGEGTYTKSTVNNGFSLKIPAGTRAVTYTSVITFSVS
jgi:hypothetical protein